MKALMRWMPALLVFGLLTLIACQEAATDKVAVPGQEGREKTAASYRALRRAYDGAPPVIPHQNFGADCMSCHNRHGLEVEGVGFAPPMPHQVTAGLSDISRCVQCHVFVETDEEFKENEFVGLQQDLRSGDRLHAMAPPVMPHAVQMRENCLACHTGPAAREEIRTSHPERERCQQCHVPSTTSGTFQSVAGQNE